MPFREKLKAFFKLRYMTSKSIPTLEKVLCGCSILYVYLNFYYRIFLAEEKRILICIGLLQFFQNCRAIMNMEKESDFISVCISTIEL